MHADASDRFGFIPEPRRWEIADYVIEPTADFDEVVKAILSESDEHGGFCYPPEMEVVGLGGRPYPNSRHPSDAMQLSPTHVIRFRDARAVGPAFRKGDGGLLINALAFIYRLRAQFHGWWFDGRVPIRVRPIFPMSDDEAARIVEKMLEFYRASARKDQIRFANALYMKTRTAVYTWPWEQFMTEYTVFEALYRSAVNAGRAKEATAHAKRFEALGDADLIAWNDRLAGWCPDFVAARNDLMHEALWIEDESDPDSRRRAGDPRLHYALAALTDRLVLSIAGVDCRFSRSAWA